MSVPAAKRRREEERDKRRAQILRAATELFARKGLENVTFGAIAKRARLSRPPVYFYFQDHRTLFLATVLQAHEKLRGRFMAALAGGSSGLEQIESLGRAYARFQNEEPAAFQLCALFDANPSGAPGAGPEADQLGQSEAATHALCTQAITHGMNDGSIRRDAGTLDNLAVTLWACVHGLAQLGAMRGPAFEKVMGLDADGLVEAGIRLLRHALAAVR